MMDLIDLMLLGQKAKKKSGAQIGHRGHALLKSDHPDKIIKHEITYCPNCKRDVRKATNLRWQKAQVFDIAELKIEVEEHQIEEKFCPYCHCLCKAYLPKGIHYGTQYGKRFNALLSYLHNYHLIPINRVTELIQDLFNHTISDGVIFNTEKSCYSNLEEFEKKLKTELRNCLIAHADETGLRIEKQTYWMQVFSNRFSSCFYVHKKRGREAMQEMQILPHFKGYLIHDHLKSYFTYSCKHVLCNAHHLRELQNVFDNTAHSWARKMQVLLRSIKQAKDHYLLISSYIKDFDQEYDRLIQLGYQQQKARSPPKACCRPKEICLLNRLKNYKTQTLSFMYQTDIPFDNNQAERDLRMMKVKMKISGCFRNSLYAQIFCRIRSYISTIKKNGMAVFQSLVDIFDQPPSFLSSIQFS